MVAFRERYLLRGWWLLLLCTSPAWGETATQGDAATQSAMAGQPAYVRSEQHYRIPDAILTDAYGKSISLAQELEADGPVIINFIYTRCATTCPALSGSFSELQRQLGPEMREVRLFTITIDPEHDSPARLREYAKRFRAGSGWMLLTGRRAEIVPVLKAFDAYDEDRSRHRPLTFLHAGPNAPWVRLDGLASATELAAEYRKVTAR